MAPSIDDDGTERDEQAVDADTTANELTSRTKDEEERAGTDFDPLTGKPRRDDELTRTDA